ncbi:hypothetical protein LTR62_002582 [Meristemomyces frigidus]|uniref:alpha-1,2-Mannosidase n=1 Tax=Meristemomyces frigidus TaxID=1508187 RepID=A0AAN7YHK1_9PEZI|nr:hypothetical protein LTR62_002582 [Meristemomyces frigidus]
MMVGRKRVRLLLGVLVFILVVVVYTRKAEVESYRDYVTEKVVGGGAVLRKPEVQEPAGALPVLKTYTPRPAATTKAAEPRPIPNTSTASASTPSPPAIVQLTSETRWQDSTTASTTPAVSTALVRMPAITDDDELPHEYGEGRVDNEDAITNTTTIVYWTKQPERFAPSTTIQLPTGSSKPMPRIQYSGNDAGQADNERLAIVKEAARHAWSGYRDLAWGMDELKPISGGYNNPFNGWGATLVDSLDTLWIMGMKESFEEAVEQVRVIDFTTSLRADIPLFETTIRYLGGLLAAYDISGAKYKVLLDQAVVLAEVLYSVFDTPNRMPVTYYRWKPAFASQGKLASNRAVMAELGSLSLEFTRLAQFTGEPKYYDAIARITDAFELWQNDTRLPGMWPTQLDASGCTKPAQNNNVILGSKSAAWASANQQLVPGGNGQVMAAGTPVHQAGRPNVLSSSNNVVDQKQRLEAQAKLNEQMKSQTTGSESDAAGKSKFFGTELSEVSMAELGSSKVKRQLDKISGNGPPLNSSHVSEDSGAASKEATREVPPTGQEVCLPQGLASTSRYSQEYYTLGGMSDSTYEYLPKQYMLLGGLVEQYRHMYILSADTVVDNLLFRPMTDENLDILISGNMKVGINPNGTLAKTFAFEGEHLTCFAGGMFALGGKLFGRPDDVEIGRKLTNGCVWAYNSTNTGIMPETFEAMPCEDRNECKYNETAYWEKLDPYELSRTGVAKAAVFPSVAVKALQTSSSSSSLNAAESTQAAHNTDAASGFEAKHVVQKIGVSADEMEEHAIDLVRAVAHTVNGAQATQAAQGPDMASDFGAKHVVQKIGVSADEMEELAIDLARAEAPAIEKRQLDERAPGTTASQRALPTTRSSTYIAQSSSAATDYTNGQPTAPPPSFYTPPVPLSHEDFVLNKIRDERLPSGMTHIRAKQYILRPEAIESVFYMYRITGEQYWRDMGWQMFLAIQQHTTTIYGNAAIIDVTATAPQQRDAMESFWLAETLKYFYLLFDDAEKWSLDEWVLNTEAHFFRRPKYDFA